MVIDTYYICGYQGFLMVIGGYSIDGYWWIFY
jgi:hypothetical protein